MSSSRIWTLLFFINQSLVVVWLLQMTIRRSKKSITLTKTCNHVQTGAAKKAQEYLIHSHISVRMDGTQYVDTRRNTPDHDHACGQPMKERQGTTLFTFSNLPSEILVHILDHLDSDPPSQTKSLQLPDANFTSCDEQPLKTISLVSRRLRTLTLPLLFRHCRLDPYYLTVFLSFIETSKLNKYVTSLAASLQGPCSHIHPAWWARLLNNIPLTRLTVHAAPHVFSELIGTHVDDSHAWAFNMPYQTMSLTQSKASAHQTIDYNQLPNLLTAKPWHTLSFNEGSSLLAYSTYEYFLKRTPSLLTSLYISRFAPGDHLYANLESFHFVAVFPFYNHVDEILKCVREMKKLKRLFVKLCPEPESTVLSDEMELARGHIDVNDPWNEFDTAYHLVAHSVRFLFLQGSLELFQVDDVKMLGIRETLVSNLRLRLQGIEGFRYNGKGIWTRVVEFE